MAPIDGSYLNPTAHRIKQLETLRFRLRQRCFEYEGKQEEKYFRLMDRSNLRMRNEWEARRLVQVNRSLSGMGY